MDAESIALLCARTAEEKKATDVKVLEVGEVVPVTDYFVLATAQNARQMKAISQDIRMQLKSNGLLPGREEGRGCGRWELVDIGTVVVHLFDAEGRAYYDLDGLWEDCDVLDLETLRRAESG